MSVLRNAFDFIFSGRVRLRQIGTFSCYFRGFLFYHDYRLGKYNRNPFCILVGAKVKFAISPDAKIIVANGASVSIGVDENDNVIPGQYNVKFKMEGSSKLIINGDFIIGKGCRICLTDKAVMQIDGGRLNGDDYINCSELIQIGKNFLASWRVDIMDTDYHPIFFNANEQTAKTKTAPVIIGDNCWIGHDVAILKGVNIDEGVIVGACSVVTRDAPNHSIVAGNPIRVIRENVYWKP